MFYNHTLITNPKNYKEKLDINESSPFSLTFSLHNSYALITIQQLLHNCGIIYVGGFQDVVSVEKLPTMIEVAKRVAELGGYSAIYTTVVMNKKSKEKVQMLRDAGFKLIRSSGIKNKRSGNKIYLMVLEIK